VRLFDLPPGTDYDLFLYDGGRTRIGASRAPDDEDERIRVAVQPGAYYIHVFPLTGRSDRAYRVNWFVR
jgi:hypothetical protein